MAWSVSAPRRRPVCPHVVGRQPPPAPPSPPATDSPPPTPARLARAGMHYAPPPPPPRSAAKLFCAARFLIERRAVRPQQAADPIEPTHHRARRAEPEPRAATGKFGPASSRSLAGRTRRDGDSSGGLRLAGRAGPAGGGPGCNFECSGTNDKIARRVEARVRIV